jgi:HK97 family phage prohead protease
MSKHRDIERRFVRDVARVETRASVSGGGNLGVIFTGRAIVYNSFSRNLGGFVERVQPGFVSQTLRDGADVLARYQHDSDMLLGRTSAGTLDLRDSDEGLDYDVPLPDTSYARDLAALGERGDVRNSSFAFAVMPGGDEWGLTDQGTPLRTLLRGGGALIDVAPVVSEAYADTTAGLRSLAEQRSLDIDTVAAAAAAHGLGELLRSQAPTVIDLGSTQTTQTSEHREQEAAPGPAQAAPAPALALARRRLALAERMYGSTA